MTYPKCPVCGFTSGDDWYQCPETGCPIPLSPYFDFKVCQKYIMDDLVKSLVSVQPMPDNIIKDLRENSIDEKYLIEQGYEPVSKDTKLIWKKND